MPGFGTAGTRTAARNRRSAGRLSWAEVLNVQDSAGLIMASKGAVCKTVLFSWRTSVGRPVGRPCLGSTDRCPDRLQVMLDGF